MSKSRQLSGTLWVGTKPAYLQSLQGLGDAVFNRHAEGLRWARVNLSGTAKEPKQDLSQQLLSQIHQHPSALLTLSSRLVSWYVGNAFGVEDDWRRPGSKADEAANLK